MICYQIMSTIDRTSVKIHCLRISQPIAIQNVYHLVEYILIKDYLETGNSIGKTLHLEHSIESTVNSNVSNVL